MNNYAGRHMPDWPCGAVVIVWTGPGPRRFYQQQWHGGWEREVYCRKCASWLKETDIEETPAAARVELEVVA